MSKTYNAAKGEWVDDAPDSNVTNPADPKTGSVTPREGVELIGGPIEGKPNCFHRGKDFMGQQIQIGAHVIVAGDEYVCKSPGSVYDAYWEKLVAAFETALDAVVAKNAEIKSDMTALDDIVPDAPPPTP